MQIMEHDVHDLKSEKNKTTSLLEDRILSELSGSAVRCQVWVSVGTCPAM